MKFPLLFSSLLVAAVGGVETHYAHAQTSRDSGQHDKLRRRLVVFDEPPSQSLTPPASSEDLVFVGDADEDNQCDICATTEQCGIPMEHELGDSFSVEAVGNGDSTWHVTCVASAPTNADCLYSPDNEPPIAVSSARQLEEEYEKCRRDGPQCCTFIYPRNLFPKGLFDLSYNHPSCTDSTCRMMERVCFNRDKVTFACPVGTMMMFRK